MRALLHKVIAKAGRSYAAGESLEEAKRLIATLVDRGYSVTLGYWNQDEEAADAVIAQYREAISYLGSLGAVGYLSVKAPAYGFDRTSHADLLRHAAERHVALHLDSLAYETADQNISLLSVEPAVQAAGLGCSLPGRWQRSLQDADLAARLGVVPRVVKGQWADPGNPDIDPRAGFAAVVKQLAGKVPLVRVATHDPVLIRESAELLRKRNTGCELELLYGLPAIKAVGIAREIGLPVRVYVPYGYAWIPYALNNLKRNPKALWWLFKDALLGSYSKTFPARVAPG